MERLSTGLRIVHASDDAAGLAISERLRARGAGALVAHRAATDALSLVHTADGSLSEIHAMLQRTRELAVQYANGSVSAADRTALQAEASQLREEVAALTARASFNGLSLLTGGTFSSVVGDLDGDVLTTALPDVASVVPAGIFTLDGSQTASTTTTTTTTTATGNNGNGNGNTQTTTTTTTTTTTLPLLEAIDAAIDGVSAGRSSLGAFGSRLGYVQSVLMTTAEQYTAAESRIRDADMAVEMTRYVAERLRRDAALAMATQARTSASRVSALL